MKHQIHLNIMLQYKALTFTKAIRDHI